ncbi:hypothetical protein SLA_3823 [Streptomyces laurentii]|uniref:Uncharacterized protein n=1 Tax=Streptomyces laurentii TaxID=39478 RepID=A0A160P207_STRLU|nr:hypothetical protein SLA_3823 [Streptomyces laurentii]
MIAVLRTRTLNALREELAKAQATATAAVRDAEQHQLARDLANDAAIRAENATERLDSALTCARADAARLEGELVTLRAQSLLDTEDRQALRMLLRTTRKQNDRADRVFVLFRSGELHSVHATRDAAEIAAEAEGAPRDAWITSTPCCPTPAPAAEVPWCIRPVPLGGTR